MSQRIFVQQLAAVLAAVGAGGLCGCAAPPAARVPASEPEFVAARELASVEPAQNEATQDKPREAPPSVESQASPVSVVEPAAEQADPPEQPSPVSTAPEAAKEAPALPAPAATAGKSGQKPSKQSTPRRRKRAAGQGGCGAGTCG